MTAGQIAEQIVDTTDGFAIVKQQDCDKIIQAIQATGDMARRTTNTQHSLRYTGSIPMILAAAWAEEWGVRLLSNEWREKAAQRLLNDPDWRSLRAPKRI